MNSDGFEVPKNNPGALINTNLVALEEYKKTRKELSLNKDSNVDILKQEINTVKNDLSELKNLLLKVLENK